MKAVSDPLRIVLDQLHGVKQRGRGYMALCPAHDDRNPSLSVREGDDGRVRVKCFAGCDEKDITHAMGLTMGNLFLDPISPLHSNRQRPPAPPRPQPAAPKRRKRVKTVNHPDSGSGSCPIATYRYCTADGATVRVKARYITPDGKKDFRWFSPTGEGDWYADADENAPATLYGAERLAAQPDADILLTESEKDKDALQARDLLAVAAGGADNWHPAMADQLAGRDVAILTHNDEGGRAFTRRATADLVRVGAIVRDVRLPGLPEKGDVVDWLENGGTVERLIAFLSATKVDEPEDAADPTPSYPAGMTLRELMAKKFAPRRAVVGELVQESSVTFFAARAKIGKTWLMCGLEIAVATGGRAFGKIPVDKRDVLAIHCEDGERRLQDRYDKLLSGAEPPDNLHIHDTWPRFDEGGIEQLEATLADNPTIGFVLIDTIAAVRPKRKRGADLVQEDYDVGKPLKALAEKYGVAILASVHTRKAGAEDFIDTISGTGGMSAGVDNILVMQRIRGQDVVTLHATGRDIREAEYALTFDGQTGQFVIAGDATEFTLSKERQDILNILRAADAPLNPAIVAEKLGKNPNTTRNLMWKMTEAGTIFTDGGGTYTDKRSKNKPLNTVNTVNGVNGVNTVNGVNAKAEPSQNGEQERLRFTPAFTVDDTTVNADRDDKPSDSKEKHESVYGVYGVYGVGEESVNADAPPEPEEIAWEWIVAVKAEREFGMPDAVLAAAVRLGCALDRFAAAEDEAARLADYLDRHAALKGGG